MFRTGGGRWAGLILIASLIECHSEAGTKIPPAARTESFCGSKAGDEREVAGIKLCWCPAGRFLMGSPPGEPERRPGEDQVGIASGFTMIFTTAAAVLNYQPSTGAPAALSADLVNPTSSSSGVFGGFVLALEFNVRFPDAGKHPNSSGLRFGDLRLCGLTTTPQYNGLTLREFLDEMNYALGGGSIPCEDGLCYDNLAALTSDVTTAFEGGVPSLFAQEHLFSGPTCPCTPGAPGCGWEPGDVVGYPQASWGDPGNTAGILLTDHFDSVYAATGFLEVGIAGAAGFSIIFTSASAVLAYQPSVGTVGPLNADLVDPTASASGAFGGEVVALKLNIDFADAGHTGGSAPVQFGDILLCDTALPTLHGSNLRALLTMANTALGGGGDAAFDPRHSPGARRGQHGIRGRIPEPVRSRPPLQRRVSLNGHARFWPWHHAPAASRKTWRFAAGGHGPSVGPCLAGHLVRHSRAFAGGRRRVLLEQLRHGLGDRGQRAGDWCSSCCRGIRGRKCSCAASTPCAYPCVVKGRSWRRSTDAPVGEDP